MTAPTSDRTRYYQEEANSGSYLSPDYNQAVIRELLTLVPAGQTQRVGDLGSGAGSNLATLRSAFPKATIVTLDLSLVALQTGRAAFDRALPTQADACAIPLASGCLDLIVCTEVLEHVENMDPVFREIRRVLNPAGRVVISSPNYLNPMGLRKWFNDKRQGDSFWDPWGGHQGFERLMLPSSMKQALAPYFQIETVRGAGYVMGWLPLSYSRVGALSDQYPCRWMGRLPIIKHTAMNRYLLLKPSRA